MGFAEFIVRALAFGIHDLFDGGLLYSALKITEMGEGTRALSIGLSLVACIVLPYLLGSVNFALIISKCFFKDDVREHGSGNAGTTNVLRTYGKKAAIWTFVGDALKGVLDYSPNKNVFEGTLHAGNVINHIACTILSAAEIEHKGVNKREIVGNGEFLLRDAEILYGGHFRHENGLGNVFAQRFPEKHHGTLARKYNCSFYKVFAMFLKYVGYA